MKIDLSKCPLIELNLSNEEYHATPGLSASRLKTAATDGWKAVEQSLYGLRPFESRALVEGSAMHLAIANVDEFKKTYYQAPEDMKTATSQKFRQQAELWGVHTDVLLTTTEYQLALNRAESIRKKIDGFCSEWVWLSEPSLFWEEENGVAKCRPDILVLDSKDKPKKAHYIEAKSAVGVSAHAARSAFWKFRYDIQQAWYERGIMECFPTLEEVDTRFVFCEKKPLADGTHHVRVFRLSDSDLMASDAILDDLVREFRSRAAEGDWADDSISEPTEIEMGLGGGREQELEFDEEEN